MSRNRKASEASDDPDRCPSPTISPIVEDTNRNPHCTKKDSVTALSVSFIRRVIMWLEA